MRRITALFLSILMLVSFAVPTIAYEVTYGDTTVIYSLTSEGENTIYAQPGDEITVDFSVLNKTNPGEAFTVETIYNDIKIDNQFFEIDDSKISSPIGLAYAHFQMDSRFNKWARFNGEHSQEPGGLRTYQSDEIVGTFKLTVKATEGQTTLESTDPWMTDNGNTAYHIDCNNLTVIIGGESAELYTVKYISEGEEVSVFQSAAGTITVGGAPSNAPENHTFKGWEYNGTTYQPGASFELTGDTTFVAKWERIIPNYTLTFDSKGGNGFESITKPENSVIDLSAYTPSREGYVFDGWYTEETYGNKVESITLDTNKTVYAKWTLVSKPTFTLTFNTDGGSTISPVTKEEGETIALSAYKPTRKGYSFAGWYSDSDLKVKITSVTLNADTTIYAKWTRSGGGGGGGGGGSADKPKDEPSKEDESVREYTTDIFGNKHPTHTGYINGYPDGTVRPDGNITREEIASILYRITSHENEAPFAYTGEVFPDVKSDRWSVHDIEYMASKEIIKGYPDGTFAPSGELTRAEFAALIRRFAGLEEAETESEFSDLDKSHWAYSDIQALSASGLVQGYEDHSFRPDRHITRAEVMTVINKILGRNPSDEYVKSLELNPFTDLFESDWYYTIVLEATTTHDYFLEKESGTEYKWENIK